MPFPPRDNTDNTAVDNTGWPDSKPREPGLNRKSASGDSLISTLISEFDITPALWLPISVFELDFGFYRLPEMKPAFLQGRSL